MGDNTCIRVVTGNDGTCSGHDDCKLKGSLADCTSAHVTCDWHGDVRLGIMPKMSDGSTPLKNETLTDLSDGAPFAYTITGLEAGTPYTVRVSAANDRGYNEPQVALPNTLAPPRQRPDLPTHVTLLVNTGASLKVLWNHPLSDGGSQVTKYKLEWDPQPGFHSGASGGAFGRHDFELFTPSTDCKLTPCEYVISSLSKGTAYFVRVFAYNAHGYSVRAAATEPVSQKPQTQPAPPATVLVSAASGSSLKVEFPPSHDNGGSEVTKYKVEWDAMGETGYLSHTEDEQNDGTATSAVLYSEHDVQTITASASDRDLGGAFRISFRGHVTRELPFDVSANELKRELELLPPVGNVGVTRRPLLELNDDNSLKRQGFVWTVHCFTYLGDDTSVDELLVSTKATDVASQFGLEDTGGTLTSSTNTATIKVKTIVRALNGFEVQTIQTAVSDSSGTLSGSFSLTFDGRETTPLPHDASAAQVQHALEGVGTGALKVLRRVREVGANGDEGYVWTVIFKERLGNVPGLQGNARDLQSSSTSGTAQLEFTDSATAPGAEGRLAPFSSARKDDMVVEATDAAMQEVIIEGLERGTPYAVRVSAWNGVGDAFGKTQYSTPATQMPSEVPEPPV